MNTFLKSGHVAVVMAAGIMLAAPAQASIGVGFNAGYSSGSLKDDDPGLNETYDLDSFDLGGVFDWIFANKWLQYRAHLNYVNGEAGLNGTSGQTRDYNGFYVNNLFAIKIYDEYGTRFFIGPAVSFLSGTYSDKSGSRGDVGGYGYGISAGFNAEINDHWDFSLEAGFQRISQSYEPENSTTEIDFSGNLGTGRVNFIYLIGGRDE